MEGGGGGGRLREAPALRYFDYPSHTRADNTLTSRCRWPIGVYRSTPHLTTKAESVGLGRREEGAGKGGGRGLKKEGGLIVVLLIVVSLTDLRDQKDSPVLPTIKRLL